MAAPGVRGRRGAAPPLPQVRVAPMGGQAWPCCECWRSLQLGGGQGEGRERGSRPWSRGPPLAAAGWPRAAPLRDGCPLPTPVSPYRCRCPCRDSQAHLPHCGALRRRGELRYEAAAAREAPRGGEQQGDRHWPGKDQEGPRHRRQRGPCAPAVPRLQGKREPGPAPRSAHAQGRAWPCPRPRSRPRLR